MERLRETREARLKRSREIMDDIHDLATLPTVVTKVISMMDSSCTTTTDIEAVIEKDQVLASKVLKLVNSSFYGFNRKIDRISDAIVLVGFNALRNLVITSSIFDFRNFRGHGMQGVIQDLWGHSIHCGTAARLIHQRLNLPKASDAFIAGILHDIGRVVICQHLQKDFLTIRDLKETEALSFCEAEERVLGTTHCEIGQILAERCKLPPLLTAVISFHHTPAEASEATDLAALIHVADVVSHESTLEMCLESVRTKVDASALEMLGLDAATRDEFFTDLAIHTVEIDASVSEFIA